jgi:TatD family-associated radical SAM protein
MDIKLPDRRDEKRMGMITYEIDNNLYVNMTNRCTNRCTFCVRNDPKGLGFDLWLEKEPTVQEVIAAVGKAERYDEVVFCGYGEPLIRLPEIVKIATHLKKAGKKVRINTNGQADLIWKRRTAPELAGVADAVSISLNAGNKNLYQELCDSEFGADAHDSIISFARDCVIFLPEVTLTVVDVIPESEIDKCARIAEAIGAKFRIRNYRE